MEQVQELEEIRVYLGVGIGGPPWEANPCGVVSLYEMLRFNVNISARLTAAMIGLEMKIRNGDRRSPVPEDVRHVVGECADMVCELASEHGMISTLQQSKRILQYINTEPYSDITLGQVRDDILQLRNRLVDDFESHSFLHLDFESAVMFQNPSQEWESVLERFGKMRYNIEESGKCFALERYGAAVFHVLQVAEYGVIEVAKLMGVQGDKPGWGSLKRLQDLIKLPYPQRIPLVQQHSKLLEDVVPLAIVIKDSWRHKLDHVDNQIVWNDTDFSPQVAEEIISATRAFMRKLAIDLAQEIP